MKKGDKKNISIQTWISILIILCFLVFFLIEGNYEFLFYAFTIGILVYLIEKTNKVFNYSNFAKYGFNIWLFLHFSGGAFKITGTRLYDFVLIPIIGEPYNILRYDQLIHGYCYFVITLFIYSIVLYTSDKKANKFLIGFITVLAGASIGAINEIIEFSTVVFFNAGDAVGGYVNNALDLVFNFIGAILSVLFIKVNNQKHL